MILLAKNRGGGHENDATALRHRRARIVRQLTEPRAPAQYFGETEFLGLSPRRTVTVTAVTFCEIAILKRRDVDEVAEVRETLRRAMKVYCDMRTEMQVSQDAEASFDAQTVRAEIEARYADAGPPDDDGVLPTAISASHQTKVLLKAINEMDRKQEESNKKINTQLAIISARLDKAKIE